MWVPRTRLLTGVTLVLIPFAVVGGMLPAAFGVSMLLIGSFILVVLTDAWLARNALAGIRVQLPELIRLQKDRPGTVPIAIENLRPGARLVRVGFAFPREITAQDQERWISLAADSIMARIQWSCTPLRRGPYFLKRVYLEASSPLGFWSMRQSHPLQVELRVYPNLFDERKHVAALFLKRGTLGAHAHRQAGQGREFEKLREYVHGDSIDGIHWKASAKRGAPVTKVFQVERTQEVYVVVDASRLTDRELSVESPELNGEVSSATELGPTNTVLECFVTSALILGLAAEQQGDQFGLITFSDKVQSFVRAKNGQVHYDACRDRLYALQPQSVTPDFDELCAFIRLKLRKRALLIFLTALDDPMLAESFVKSVKLISRQHLVIVDMLKPPAANPLFSQSVAQIDDLYVRLGGHLNWHQLRELQITLQRLAVRFALINPSNLTAELVAQHADVKARQLI